MSETISAEAIEAAMEVFYRYGYPKLAEAERAFAEAQTRAALEAAAPHMQVAALMSGVQRDIEAVKTMAEVLVDHQRQNSSSCLCGWAKLGHSHSEHQAEALSAAGFGLTPNPYRSQDV